MPEMQDTERTGVYKECSRVVDEWLRLHEDERFDLDMVCRHLNIAEPKKRHMISIKLRDEVRAGHLEKNDRLYRVTNTNSTCIRWWEASDDERMDVEFPWSHEDGTYFKFRDYLVVSPGDLHVLAGVSNMGKTTYATNMLFENMQKYHCVLMGNEYTGAKFKRRVSRVGWANPMNGDGKPIFELVERHSGWKDIIQPDAINIIDWINMDDEFYKIGSVLEGIKSKLRGGMALVVLQKSPGKELGLGGGFGMHLASLYLTLDFERLTVIKAKEWHTWNPNGSLYRFKIAEGGTQFQDIHRVLKCSSCAGTGKYRGNPCGSCEGEGVIDAKEPTVETT